MFNVLFVCTENTCRSPLAEYLTKHLLKELNIKNVIVKSCGISVTSVSKIADNSKKILKELGIKFRFKPKQITNKMVEEADLILTMTMQHKIAVSLKYDCFNKLYTFAEYTNGKDILDPYGGDLNVYRQTASDIYNNCLLLIKKLSKKGVINV